MVGILRERPGQLLGNLVEHNIFLNPVNILILREAKGLIKFNQNFEEGASNFNTAMHQNFQVTPKSKPLDMGYSQIPSHEIGRY